MADGEKPGVDFRDEGKHTRMNDLLFVKVIYEFSALMLFISFLPVIQCSR